MKGCYALYFYGVHITQERLFLKHDYIKHKCANRQSLNIFMIHKVKSFSNHSRLSLIIIKLIK